MRLAKTRTSDTTFDINLAPFLDIIVSIVPLLLLSVVFVEIKMIETPVPQVVQNAIQKEENEKNPEVSVRLLASKKSGLAFEVNRKGVVQTISIPLKDSNFDLKGLTSKAADLKAQHPSVFKVGLVPDEDVSFNELVQIMDQIRKTESGEKLFAFTDDSTGQKVETDLMFPNVTFANVIPGE